MLSRIAESLFWIGRYIERADGTARILDVHLQLLLEDPWIDEDTAPSPVSGRSQGRLAVEEAWLSLGARSGKAVQMFRLSGIYGPGRTSMVERVRRGAPLAHRRVTNRIHGLLTQIHPALERAIGGKLHHKAILELLHRYGGPTGLRTAGKKRIANVVRPRAPRSHHAIVEAVMAALDEQSVTVPGTRAAELVLPQLADQLTSLLAQREQAATQVEEMLDAHPLAAVLTSMPGIGVRTGARILLEVGDGTTFPTPGHLAAYAGLAPVTRRSGSSIRGEHPSRGGNKNLKRAMFLSAFAALSDPTSRAYYDRKRAQGKKHNAALICLARRRCDVIYAMLRDGTPYQPRPASAA